MRGRLLVLAALLAGAPIASAHENQLVVDETRRVPAAGAVELAGRVHHHRLVGVVTLVDARAGEAILLRVEGPDGSRIVAGPAQALRVNALLGCCDDASWTSYEVRIETRTSRETDVRARLALLHDGFSVAAERAEPGAASSMVLFVGVPFLFALWPRRAAPRSPRPLRSAALAIGAAGILALALCVPAILAFGGGPVAALVAAAISLPWLPGPFVTTQDVTTLALLALWAVAVVRWGQAARTGVSRATIAMAVALATIAIAGGLAWALEYGTLLVPIAVAIAGAAAPLAWTLPPVRRALARPAA